MIDKHALQAEKEKLKQELKYYNKRLRDLQIEIRTKQVYECDSSDSENETFSLANIGPPISQLKSEQYLQQTCLQATQELTSVVVLQAEVECLIEVPKYERGSTIKEPGTWSEVTAECRVDLVPFSINFYTHKANRMFAPTLYRGLTVLPVKKAQEIELSKSVLSDVEKPSDAVEVLKSYAKAYRARRTTLARLADKYANELHMEPLAEGGYLLKCGSILELSWRLENRLSPLSAFHHKMKFDLDYMDESHLKTITQAHKKLSDPSIDVNERTLLLSKIISTCLELKVLHEESMESETESKKLEKTVLEDDSEENCENSGEKNEDLGERNDAISENNDNIDNAGQIRDSGGKNREVLKKNKDAASKSNEKALKSNENVSKSNKKSPQNVANSPQVKENEIMAPPKSLPKKTKPKAKEDTTDNRKSVKRTAESEKNETTKTKTNEESNQNGAKKTKTTIIQNIASVQKESKKGKTNEKNDQNIANDIEPYTSFVATLNEKRVSESSNKKKKQDDVQNNAKKPKLNDNQAKHVDSEKDKNTKTSKATQKITQKHIDDPKNDQNNEKNLNSNKKLDKIKYSDNIPTEIQNKKSKTVEKTSTEKQISKNNLPKAKMVDHDKENSNLNKNQEIINQNNEKESQNVEKNTEKIKNNKTKTKNDIKSLDKAKKQKPLTNSEKTIKISKNATQDKNANATKNGANPVVPNSTEKIPQSIEKSSKTVEKTSEAPKNLQKLFENKTIDNKQPKNNKKNINIKEITDKNSTKNVANPKNMVQKTKLLIKSHKNTPKVNKTGNTESVKDGKISKIPQKKFGSNSDTNLKNVLRISPRKLPSKFKSPSDTNLLGKIAKVHTNIPMLKKPAPKV